MSETDRPFVIAIDGPSGSGKSSTSRGVAERLGLAYLDTGAMYRAATWLVLGAGTDLDRPELVTEAIAEADFGWGTDPRWPGISVNGVDVTAAIRRPEISAAVSAVATIQSVRRLLIDWQRRIIAEAGRVVVEGRDITTVVAPDANVRALLVADPDARVARRKGELGGEVADHDVRDQVIRRDRDDATVAAFEAAAPGVEVIDSTSLNLDQVIEVVVGLARAAGVEAGHSAEVGQGRA